MLVVVGPNWFARGVDGSRRIDKSDDWVRHEVRSALAKGARVVVVRFNGASRLSPDDLPEDIRGVAVRQDCEVTHRNITHSLPALMDELFRLEPDLRIGATDGLEGLDEWWAGWSGITRPVLPPALPVAGRDAAVRALGDWLAAPPDLFQLRCASYDDGSAFAAAVLDLHHADVRAVRVTSHAGATHCADLPSPLLVVVAASDVDVQALVARGLHVLLLLHVHTSKASEDGLTLPRLSAAQALDVFVEAGLPPARAGKQRVRPDGAWRCCAGSSLPACEPPSGRSTR